MADENTNPASNGPSTGVRPVTVKAPAVRIAPTTAAPAVRPPPIMPTVGAPAVRANPQASGVSEGYTPTIRVRPVSAAPAAAPAQAPSGIKTLRPVGAPAALRPVGAPAAAPAAPAAPAAAAPSNAPKPFAPKVSADTAAPNTPKPFMPHVPAPTVSASGVPQAAIEAAKAKTSRISLDSALTGNIPEVDNSAPKTIRLKRPSEAPVGKITSHLTSEAAAAVGNPSGVHSSVTIPSSAADAVSDEAATIVRKAPPPIPSTPMANRTVEVPLAADVEEEKPGETSLTRKKTIKVKRRGASAESGAEGGAPKIVIGGGRKKDGAEGGEGGAPAEGAAVVARGPVAKTHWIFPTLGVAACLVFIALIVVLYGPDREIFDSTAWVPNLPNIKLPGMAPIPNR